MTARRASWAALALLALGVFAEWAALQREPLQEAAGAVDFRLAATDLATGLVVGACGLISWRRRPGNLVGPLLAATAAAWFLGTFAESGVSSYADFGGLCVTLHRGPLLHAALAYPGGRLRHRLDQAVVGLGYATAAIADVGQRTDVTIVIALLAFSVVVRRYAQASARGRVALRPVVGGVGALAVVLVTGAAVDAGGASAATDRAVLVAYEIVVAATSTWLVLELLRGRWTEAAVAGLVVELGGTTGAPLRDRLAHALGDPSVVVGYRVPDREGFVDAEGRPVELPAAAAGREVTYVGDEDPVAVLVHDPGAVDDPALLEPVAAATRIAVSSVQLQSEIRGRLDDLTRSRRRIVEAGDAQRRRLERQLREGAQARLATIAELLERSRGGARAETLDAMLAEAVSEIERGREEISEFARGVHPAVLSDGGLHAALVELAARATVPVELSVSRERFEPPIEAAAYFVCAEALANTGKYARASRATVKAVSDADRLTVEVTDDGVGAADIAAGSGLRGLRDRIEALGGTLNIASPPRAGTRVTATLPTAEPVD
ncbi:MAG TPA: ATP-binding protein [Thermoleophilaceae bacterium]